MDGTTENIREHWGLPHTAAFIFCPLRADKKIPTSVSIYAYDDVKQTRNNDTVYLPKPNNRIIVHNNKEHKFDAAHETMAACVGPIFSQYSKVYILKKIDFNCVKHEFASYTKYSLHYNIYTNFGPRQA